PEMNGRELVECIKVRSPEIKYLFMTGYTPDVITEMGLIEQDMKIIIKPFTLEELAKNVRYVLDR
ncbi:MAG: hybrid sensor histidine kinase/response regulator, partial [Thermodesulfovibrionales bacterium]